MNGTIGFIIFVVIAIVSVIKRIQEAKQEEENRRAAPRPRTEDLPEATRRMLYGDTEVPTARERQAPTQPTVIVARPRQVIEENEEGPRPAAPRPLIPPQPPRQPDMPSRRLPIPPRPMQPSRPVVMQPRNVPPLQPRTIRTMPAPDVARQIMAGAGRIPDYAPPAREVDDGDWVRREQLQRHRQTERAQGRAATAENVARKRRVFQAGTDLRRAILMNEILGPPVAMREPFGPFQNGPCL